MSEVAEEKLKTEIRQYEEVTDNYKNTVIAFFKNRQASDADFVARVESLLDKQALLAIGAIPLSIAFLGSLIDKHSFQLKEYFIILIYSWILLLCSAILVACIKLHFTIELETMRSKHEGYELRLKEVLMFPRNINEKATKMKEVTSGFKDSLHYVSLPIEAIIGSLITLLFGIIWMIIFAVFIVFSA